MNYRSFIKWMMVKTSVFTMVMAPVSQGFAAQRNKQEIDRAKVQSALVSMGLNKSITYGEFYSKNKHLFPERVQKQLGPYFTKFSKERMPQFQVSQAKASDGTMVPVLRVVQKGEMHNIQITGGKDRYARFNNTPLSEVDIINIEDMMIRISASDMKLRRQAGGSLYGGPMTSNVSASNVRGVASTSGYPAISKEVWNKLKPTDKASYILNMRDLWTDAKKVLAEQRKIEQKKSGQNKGKKSFSYLESVIEFFIGEKSQAQSTSAERVWKDSPKKISVKRSDSGVDTNSASLIEQPITGTTCIVAGYISRYTSRGTCSIDNIIRDNRNNGFIDHVNFGSTSTGGKQHSSACDNSKGDYACNPLIYGTPGGRAICINTRSQAFQKATHWAADGGDSCDQKSRLTTGAINLAGDIKSSEYYADAASKAEKIALDEQMKEDFSRSKQFIDGLLLFRGKNALGSDPLDESTFELIKNIRDNFNADIQKARASCSAQMNYSQHERNFYGACDQLHKRFLFVANVLAKNPGCPDGGTFDSETLMCKCEGSDPVLPGNKCVAKPVSPKPDVCDPDVKPTPPSCVDVTPPAVVVPPAVVGGKCDPACNDKTEVCEKTEYNGIEVYTCVAKEVVKKKNKFGDFMLKALPWVAGAGVLAAMYFLWKPKIPKLSSAGDLCPDGKVAPCAVTCTAPQANINGTCACAACPPGQMIVDASACLCASGSTGDIVFTCSDGVTQVKNLSECPTEKFKCWDGTLVDNAINCPEQLSVPGKINSDVNSVN